MLLAYKPACCACFSKAAVLYHPGEPGLPGCGGFSKNTPMVEALEPKALVILEAKPKPVEAPITNTFLAPAIDPFDFTYSIWFFTLCSQPFGWAVKQINPLILGSIIILFSTLIYIFYF